MRWFLLNSASPNALLAAMAHFPQIVSISNYGQVYEGHEVVLRAQPGGYR